MLWPLCCKRVFDARRLAYSEQIPRRASTGKVALVSSPALLTRLNLPNAVTEPNDLVAVFSSGGKLEQAQAQGASAALGAPVLEILGSTETGGIAWRAHNAAHWRELDSRLQLRSPYLPDPDFWFVCNDLVQVVSERSFIHLGRADRIVKVEEKRLSLDAMEKHLAQFDGVIAAKAHMAADSRHDFGMVCALQPELLARLSAGQKRAMVSALKAHLLEAFEPVVLPRRWRFVPQLPINAQGKTTHAGLQALFERRAIPIIFTQHLARVCEILLCPQAEQLYFDGHFPRIAVLPGAAMLDWAIHLAASHFALAKTPSRIDALKFQKVVFPYHAILLRLIYDQGKNSVNFTYESTVGAHASGRLIYTAEQSA